MEFTRYMVEYLKNNLGIPSLNIVPIYDVKTVDVKRGNYLFVYTTDRIFEYFVGNKNVLENIGIVLDFRGDNYEMYNAVKGSLKLVLQKLICGDCDNGIFKVEIAEETELSNKARGLYRFTLNVYIYRVTDYEE